MKRRRCEHCDSGRGLNPTERGLVPPPSCVSVPQFVHPGLRRSLILLFFTRPSAEVRGLDHKRAVDRFSRGIEFPELRTKQPLNTGLLSSTTDEVFMAYYYFPVWLVRGHAPL